MCNLLILGAGQHGHIVKETAELMNCYKKIDFLDDNSEESIGKIEEYNSIGKKYDQIFVALGNNEMRINLLDKIKNKNFKIATIIHPSAIISKTARIAPGTVIEAGAIINTNTIIEEGCIISIGAIIDHDVTIDKGCHVRPGVVINSNKKIDKLIEIKK